MADRRFLTIALRAVCNCGCLDGPRGRPWPQASRGPGECPL